MAERLQRAVYAHCFHFVTSHFLLNLFQQVFSPAALLNIHLSSLVRTSTVTNAISCGDNNSVLILLILLAQSVRRLHPLLKPSYPLASGKAQLLASLSSYELILFLLF